jgi:hypothetical protein
MDYCILGPPPELARDTHNHVNLYPVQRTAKPNKPKEIRGWFVHNLVHLFLLEKYYFLDGIPIAVNWSLAGIRAWAMH